MTGLRWISSAPDPWAERTRVPLERLDGVTSGVKPNSPLFRWRAPNPRCRLTDDAMTEIAELRRLTGHNSNDAVTPLIESRAMQGRLHWPSWLPRLRGVHLASHRPDDVTTVLGRWE
jgi:hypothetical protein